MADPIRVGHIDLSFHDATARAVEHILAAHGLAVARRYWSERTPNRASA